MKRKFEYYCKEPENIENYEAAKADNFKDWDCHHRLETHNSDGERRLVDITMDELKALDMYYNRPASELIFLTKPDHVSLHWKGGNSTSWKKGHITWNKGKCLSEKTKKKLSEALKGRTSPMKGKHLSEEAKRKLSKAIKGKKRPGKSNKGKHWKLVDGKRVYY